MRLEVYSADKTHIPLYAFSLSFYFISNVRRGGKRWQFIIKNCNLFRTYCRRRRCLWEVAAQRRRLEPKIEQKVKKLPTFLIRGAVFFFLPELEDERWCICGFEGNTGNFRPNIYTYVCVGSSIKKDWEAGEEVRTIDKMNALCVCRKFASSRRLEKKTSKFRKVEILKIYCITYNVFYSSALAPQ